MNEEKNDEQGFVYVMSNPSYKKNFLKVGYTTKTPEERAKQLYQTGVPNEFKIEYKVEFENARKAEKQIHSSLEKCRHNKNREFFTCGFRKTKNAINKADGRIEIPNNNNDGLVKILIAINIFLILLIIIPH